MYTDPKRISADIPGTVAGNPVFTYHDTFNPDVDEVADLKARYEAGKVGDVEVKEKLARALNNFLDPIRQRRVEFEEPGLIEEIIVGGTEQVRDITRATLIEMKKAMGLSGVWNRVRRKAERRSKKLAKE